MTEAERFINIRWAGLDFVVTPQTFAPRESSLGLPAIVAELNIWNTAQAPRVLVDMCCGSGALGIAVYLVNRTRFDSVVFLDSSADAIISAEANRIAYGVPGRVHMWHTGEDLRVSKPVLVLCNPPFLDSSAAADLLPWEQSCVSCAQNGLAVIAECFKSIAQPKSWMLLKCLESQLPAIADLTPNGHALTNVVTASEGAVFSFWEPKAT